MNAPTVLRGSNLVMSAFAILAFATIAVAHHSTTMFDMQKTAEYLKGKGVEITWGPMVRDTYARAEIRDPNGYGIELRQWF